MYMISRPSPNFNARPKGARLRWIILHYTAFDSAEYAVDWLCNPEKKVSAHYLIGRQGEVYHMVPDHLRAWHAGVSQWGGEENLNDSSLGVELDNNGFEPFASVQVQKLLALLSQLCAQHNIPKSHILGHEDIAPGRKIDPGPLFPWQTLYAKGFAGARQLSSHMRGAPSVP